MFPSTKEVELKNAKVMCYDLTYGYMLGLEDGSIEDTAINAVLDGTDFKTVDDLKPLRGSEIEILYQVILRLSYPHAYDENGELKTLDANEKQVENKKKV